MDDKTVIRFPNDNTVIRPRPGGKRQSNSRKNHNSSAIASDRTLVNFKNNHSLSNQSELQKTNFFNYIGFHWFLSFIEIILQPLAVVIYFDDN